MSKEKLVEALEREIAQMQAEQLGKEKGFVIGSKPTSTRAEMLDNHSLNVLKGGRGC